MFEKAFRDSIKQILREVLMEEMPRIIESLAVDNKEESKFVTKVDRNKILDVNSDSKAREMLSWGNKNGFKVAKRGASRWNKSDLKVLCTQYWSVFGYKKSG